jgi:MFS transporter, OPA family, sugar phosphate sensor protein UhpC
MAELQHGRARRDRDVAWGLSWLAYATYYTGRKGFSVAKKSLHEKLGVSEGMLGVIDTGFLVAYSAGQFVSGLVGDRIGSRRLVGWGMLASAACCAAFGASSLAILFVVFFCLNGFAQSTGWPGTTRAMAEWTTPANRGTVMAFWATCYQVGGIVATALAARLLGAYGWRWAFFGPALLIALVGLLVLLFLRVGPGARAPRAAAAVIEVEPSKVASSPAESRELDGLDEHEARRRARREVLRSVVIWCYGASYFCIKFIRYALLFWTPFYLSKRFGYGEEQAAYMATAFEVGGVVGVIGIGIASDRLRRYSRSALSAAGLVALAGALVLYAQFSAGSTLANVLWLGLVGATLFGPDSLLSGAASQDVGGPYAAATATGFVNGVGSIGAMFTGIAIPAISTRWGWDAVFWSFVGLALLAAVALVPTLRRGPAPAAGR